VDPCLTHVDRILHVWLRILHCGSEFTRVDTCLTHVDRILHVWIRILHRGTVY